MSTENRLHLDGATYHFSRQGQNEANYGLGFSYGLGMLRSGQGWLDRTPLALDADVYRDSFFKTGHTVAVTGRLIIAESWSAGFKAGIVHEAASSRQSGSYYVPYVLPFLDVAMGPSLSLRSTLIPHVGHLTDGMLTFQVLVAFGGP